MHWNPTSQFLLFSLIKVVCVVAVLMPMIA
jgi:hypothetical protein